MALSKIGYLPYGKSAGASASFGFTAQRIDPETNGLYYYRARHYLPAWGRFLQTDPIGTQGGVNLYAYVGNDPLNLLDSFGLSPDSPSTSWASTIAIPGVGGLGEIAAGIGVRAAAAAFALPTAIAGGILAMTSTSTAGRSQDEVQNVVRAGVATPIQLMSGSAEHRSVPGLYGFSVQSEPGRSVDDLARAGAFPHRQISVTTTAELAGVGVAVVPSPGAGYHATVQVPNPLPGELASSISGVFRLQDNPFRVPR